MALGIPFLYILGGFCVLAATAIALTSVVQHLLYFHQPEFQRYICRILLMVPIYSVTSWFSMFFPEQKLWIASLRESYEAFAVYSFTMLLFAYVGGERRLAINLEMKEKIEHPWPFNRVFRGLYPGAAFLRLVKAGVLQFVLIRPLTAVCILAGTGLSVYHEGYFGLNDAYLYVFLLSNLSFSISALHVWLFVLNSALSLLRSAAVFPSDTGLAGAAQARAQVPVCEAGHFLDFLVRCRQAGSGYWTAGKGGFDPEYKETVE